MAFSDDYDIGSYEDVQEMRQEARVTGNKTFLKCKARAKTFDNGGTVINLGVKVDDLIAFAQEHGNQGGWLNLVIAERRTPGDYGDTHMVYLDPYTPKDRG